MRTLPFVFLLAAFTGCASSAHRALEDSAWDEAPQPGPAITLNTIDALPNLWSAAEGWVFGSVVLLGDQNGDGYEDAAVHVGTEGADGVVHNVLIVNGPLRTPKILPGDESAVILGAGVETVGDATGDGVVDLDVAMFDVTGLTVVPGPFHGTIDPVEVGIPHPSGLLDVNGDGVLDQFTFGTLEQVKQGLFDDRVDITWGPADRWSTGISDLVLEPSCAEGDKDVWSWAWPQAWEDTDGDGSRELWFGGYEYTSCSDYVVPVANAGVVDPDTTAGAVTGVRPLTVISDQTGDGVADVLLETELTVLAGPVTLADGEVTSTTHLSLDPQLTRVFPQHFDLDGDGSADFVGVGPEIDASNVGSGEEAPLTPATGEVMVVVYGGDRLTEASYSEAWDLRGGWPAAGGSGFVEDGAAVVLVAWSGGITAVDLGSATLVP